MTTTASAALHPQRVPVPLLPIERLDAALSPAQIREWERTVRRGRELMAGRVVWCVSSTARGGGVAEMLHSLLGYARGAGVDARWMVIQGTPQFFEVTKRIHNNLHGAAGDGGPLGDDERSVYEAVSERNAGDLERLIRPGDAVLLHDPQTAGLVPLIKSLGAHVVWRAHIGLDMPNELARRAWAFLLPYVSPADAYVFSRRGYRWEGLDVRRFAVIPPSIDAFSAKNKWLEPGTVRSILRAAGLMAGRSQRPPVFERDDGSPGRVDRHATVLEESRLHASTPVVVQVSRWDRLKGPVDLIETFARDVVPRSDAHLLYAGPDVLAVTDDPEGTQVWQEAAACWSALSREQRGRIHLARLPMDDPTENAVIVNAIQRHADVVVQKSLAEGFGLIVAEAMWKSRPVVASRIGGIRDQIVDGTSGLLVSDPRDLAEYGAAVCALLSDPDNAQRIAAAAHASVQQHFLGPHHLGRYFEVIQRLLSHRKRTAAV